MANWKHTFAQGKELRELIHADQDSDDYDFAEHPAAIVSLIVEGLRKFSANPEVQNFIYEHEGDAAEIRTNPDEFFDPYLEDDPDNPEQAYVNSLLADFYDLCDAELIWVET